MDENNAFKSMNSEHISGIEKTASSFTKTRKSIVLPIAGIILSVGLVALAWSIATCRVPGNVSPKRSVSGTSALAPADIDKFIETEVLPALDAYDIRNEASVNCAVDRISREMEEYRAGVGPFVEDITSWKTRFGVIRRMGSDFKEKQCGNVANAREVQRYVSGKFESHLFTDAKLEALVAISLNQFRDDLAANRNILHAEVKSAWQKSAHAQCALNPQTIIQEVNASVKAASGQIAMDSVSVGLLAFIGGWAFEETMEALVKAVVVRVAARIATSAAITAAASGGATATTAVGGGGIGTFLGGPAGTAIGLAVGIVAGSAVDAFTTNRLRKKLTAQCNLLVTEVENQILYGTADEPGIKHTFSEFIRLLRTEEKRAIQTSLKEAVR